MRRAGAAPRARCTDRSDQAEQCATPMRSLPLLVSVIILLPTTHSRRRLPTANNAEEPTTPSIVFEGVSEVKNFPGSPRVDPISLSFPG
jgi:hypothetical protein